MEVTVIDAEANPNARERVIDEIKEFQDGRYVGAVEAMWRNYKYKMHLESSVVFRLPIHLEGQEAVEFDGDVDLNTLVQRGPPDTALTLWFRYNLANEGE